MKLVIWFGIVGSLAQAGLLSGLNLAVFSIGRLRLEVESAGGSRDARTVLELRRDSNATLATILWGNVASNVLLTLLIKSVLAGVTAFFLSALAVPLGVLIAKPVGSLAQPYKTALSRSVSLRCSTS